jgi:cytochrome P450
VAPDAVQEVLVGKADAFRKGRIADAARVFLGDGLFTKPSGEEHQRQRRLINPSFRHDRLEAYGRIMVEQAEPAVDAWIRRGRVDLTTASSSLTLGIVARTLFGRQSPEKEAQFTSSLGAAIDYLDLAPLPLAGLVMRLPTGRRRRFLRAKPALDALVTDVITARRASGESGEDLLQALLDARDEDTGEAMSERQIADEVFTFAIAGHETTSLAITWTLWQLAHEPEAETLLHEELDRELAGRAPSVQDLPRLAWTKQVLLESMRLYPPAWLIARVAAREVVIDGWRIPEGELVMTLTYLTHRHPEHWDDPERFDPRRFAPETNPGRHRFAFFPFGGGTRKCIGNGFAMMEAQLLLATICQRARLVPTPGAPPPGLKPQLTLRPARPVDMTVRARGAT